MILFCIRRAQNQVGKGEGMWKGEGREVKKKGIDNWEGVKEEISIGKKIN